MTHSPGELFRKALDKQTPLQIAGVINAYIALMAKHTGFEAIYLSGAGVANSSYGLPDLGLTTLDNVLEDVRRITDAVDTPLLVDIDTGWGNTMMVERTIRAMIKAGAAAVHMEDQITNKRCGHRKGKSVISTDAMVEKIHAAVNAKTDPSFVIMARTDAYAVEGIQATINRCLAYKEAGADMFFLEAMQSLEEYTIIKNAVNLPILINLTEFGQTPLFTLEEVKAAQIDMALYPLSANRAMNLAALRVLETIKHNGSQKDLLEIMQTREELYGFLDYEAYEMKQTAIIQELK